MTISGIGGQAKLYSPVGEVTYELFKSGCWEGA